MKGGETGDSFAEAYESALNIMDIHGFDKQDTKDHYDSINFLAEIIRDPDNETQNITRFGIYKRYRKKLATQC